MDYLWNKDVKSPEFPTLNGNMETEVLVIGGGLAGILCALKLHEAGIDYMLVEAKNIGGGITKGTTAVLTAQHDTLYQDIIKKFGIEKAKIYLDANLEAVQAYRELSHKIDFDFENKPSIMFSMDDKDKMKREVAALKSLDFNAEFTTETALPFSVAGAVVFPDMAQFHPLKFLYGAAEGLNIYGNTFITKLKGTTAYTDKGYINAKKIIVATHYPFKNSRGLYFMKLYQKRSFVIALENAPDIGCTIDESAKNGIFLRNYNGLLLIGGGGHRTGKQGGGFDAPRNFARRYFPQAKEKYAWANQDCVSLDGVPYIGSYSPSLPNVYVASGFNLWGMTTSMISSEIITDLVMGRKNKYVSAFSPSRSMIRGQLFSNLGTTFLDFITPSTKRCPHLGCTLKWNSAEHSWDCPCHGSRFNSHGKLINNPAMKDCHMK